MFDDINFVCVGHFCSLPVAMLCGFLLGLGDSSFNTQVQCTSNCTIVLLIIDNNSVLTVCESLTQKNKLINVKIAVTKRVFHLFSIQVLSGFCVVRNLCDVDKGKPLRQPPCYYGHFFQSKENA